MAILAECDICGNQHRVKDGLVGSSIRCKDCGVIFVVPRGPAISAETYVEIGGRLRLRAPIEDAVVIWPRFVTVLVSGLVIVALAGSIWIITVLVRPVLKKTNPDPIQSSRGAARSNDVNCGDGREGIAGLQ